MRLALKQAGLSLGFAVALALVAPRQASALSVCDLTTAGSSCSYGQGLFYTDEQHPTGTGYIDSFLRLQQKGYEQGYNTSSRPVQFDEKTDPNFTTDVDLGLANVGIKNIGGVNYREFFLDVNEAVGGGKSYITLDQLEIFVSNQKALYGYSNMADGTYSNAGANTGTGALIGAKKIYDMDAAGDMALTLNYNLSGSGSGSSDMVFYLPDSLFSGYKYVTLYSQFGNIDGSNKKYASDAGFEEWFTKSSVPPPNTAVPEPASLLLVGTGIVAALRRRQMSAKAKL